MKYRTGYFEDEDFKEFVAGAALGIIVEESKGSAVPTVRYFTHEKKPAHEDMANTQPSAVTSIQSYTYCDANGNLWWCLNAYDCWWIGRC